MARTGRADSQAAVIGRSTSVRGKLSGDGDLVVEGSVEGSITIDGALTLAEGSRATSNVDARTVTVHGELEGEVRARGVVHIGAGARVRGDVHGESVAIDDGAEYTGRLDADFELPPELGGASRPKAGARR